MGDSDAGAAEARWRNYQQLIWTQQQLQLQIQQQQQHQQQQQQQQHHQHQQQQQQLQSSKMNGMEIENGNVNGGGGMNGHVLQPITLSEKFPVGKSKGDGMDPWDSFDAQAAFLGPTLWDKRLPYDGQDFKLEYVDLEEFLTENGIPVDSHNTENHYKNGNGPSNNNNSINTNNNNNNNNNNTNNHNNNNINGQMNGHSGGMQSSDQMENGDCSPQEEGGMIGQYGGNVGPSRNQQLGHINSNGIQGNLLINRGPSSLNQSENSRSPSPCGSSISRSSDSSNSLPNHHHYHEMQQMGPDFDPRTRIFTEDELKPQPMIKKSKKQFVPDEQKDAKYWARRRKNNLAAKRSRDARRVKENQIAMRACFLEKENSILKQEIDRIQKENMLLKEQLNCCRREH